MRRVDVKRFDVLLIFMKRIYSLTFITFYRSIHILFCYYIIYHTISINLTLNLLTSKICEFFKRKVKVFELFLNLSLIK